MIFKKLKIKDFRNIDNKEFDFEKINIFIGASYSGKSSTLQALEYLLTDNLQGKLTSYIRDGKDCFELTLDFEKDGKTYTYYVKRAKSKTEKELKVGSETFYNSDASNEIKNLFNSEMLLYSAISPQKSYSSIITENPSNRLEKLKTLFKVDKLNDVEKEMKLEQDYIKDKLVKLNAEKTALENMVFEYQDLPELVEVDFNRLVVLKDLKNEYEKNLINYNNYLRAVSDYELNLKTKNILEKQLIEINQKAVSLNNEINELSFDKFFDMDNYYKVKQNYDNFIHNQTNEKTELSYKEALNGLEVKPLNKVLDSDIEDTSKEIVILEQKIKDTKNKLKLAENKKCPTCGQSMGHFDTFSLEKDLECFEMELKQKSMEYSKLKRIKLTNEKQEKENIRIKAEIKDLNNRIAELNYKEVSGIFKDVEKTYNNLKVQYEINNKNTSKYGDLKIKLDSLEKEKNAVISKIETFNLVEPEKVVKPDFDYEDELESLTKASMVYEEVKKYREIIKTTNEKTLEKEKQRDKMVDNLGKEIEQKEVKMRVIKESRVFIKNALISYLVVKGAELITKRMNMVFRNIHEHFNLYFENDKSGVYFYYGNEDNYREVSLSSGFEEQLISLCFRLAMSEVYGYNFIILDEIDSQADNESSVALFENLLGMDFLKQYFIITHKTNSQELLINEGSKIFNFKRG